MEEKKKFIIGGLNNWYSEGVVADIWYLIMYHNEMENSIEDSIQDFEQKKEWLPNDPDNPEMGMHLYYKQMDGQTFDLETIIKNDYPNQRRKSLLILLMSTVEKRLTSLCETLKEQEYCELTLQDINSKKGHLDKISVYLEKVIKLGFTEELNDNWDKLSIIQTIRNDLVHELGYYVSNRDYKNKKCNFMEQADGIRLSEINEYILDKTFIGNTISLVDEIFLSLEKSIRNKYDFKYKLN